MAANVKCENKQWRRHQSVTTIADNVMDRRNRQYRPDIHRETASGGRQATGGDSRRRIIFWRRGKINGGIRRNLGKPISGDSGIRRRRHYWASASGAAYRRARRSGITPNNNGALAANIGGASHSFRASCCIFRAARRAFLNAH